jgi:hypothetical protein
MVDWFVLYLHYALLALGFMGSGEWVVLSSRAFFVGGREGRIACLCCSYEMRYMLCGVHASSDCDAFE